MNGSTSTSAAAPAPAGNANTLGIGRLGSGSVYFPGLIDEVAVYTRYLTR